MTGFEPAASCSQNTRSTNWATPGYGIWFFRVIEETNTNKLHCTKENFVFVVSLARTTTTVGEGNPTGLDGWDWTNDLALIRRVLYRLSYVEIFKTLLFRVFTDLKDLNLLKTAYQSNFINHKVFAVKASFLTFWIYYTIFFYILQMFHKTRFYVMLPLHHSTILVMLSGIEPESPAWQAL